MYHWVHTLKELGQNHASVTADYPLFNVYRKGGADFSKGWGDLLLMFGALNDPATAVKYIDQNPKWPVTKGGKKTYVVFNFGREKRTIRFSDGTKMSATPRVITTHRGQ